MRMRTFMSLLICLKYVVSCTPPHPDCVILVIVRTKTTTNPICSYNSLPSLFLFRVVFIKPTVLSRSSQCYSSGRSFCWKKCKSKIKERNQSIYQNKKIKTTWISLVDGHFRLEKLRCSNYCNGSSRQTKSIVYIINSLCIS